MAIFKNRKFMYLILGLVVVAVTSLTMAYAILNVTLNVQGNAEVFGSNWNIHFGIPIVDNGSSTANVPVVAGNILTFNTSLKKPGDYYKFTVDVINDGDIDAIIEKVENTTELTDEQLKYINYGIEYSDGGSVGLRQQLLAKSSVTLKVKVEFKKDISSNDLPSYDSNINFSFKITYSQNSVFDLPDENGNINNGFDLNTYVVAIDQTFNVMPGMTLYDAINYKYDEMSSTVENFPRASNYTTYTTEEDHVFLNEYGDILNLKKTIIEEGKTYKSVSYTPVYPVNDADVQNGNFTYLSAYSYKATDYSTYMEPAVIENDYNVVLTEKNNNYFNIVANHFANFAFGALNEENISTIQYEYINDYVIAFPEGQSLGCGSYNNYGFISITDMNGNFIKINSIVDEKKSIILKSFIGNTSPTYEEAKVLFSEMFKDYGG